MELSDRKEHIMRCIKLGMDLTSSMYCAECSESEIALLEKDEDFQSRIKTQQSIEEYNLLQDFDRGVEIAVSKGNTSGLQWKLAHINKRRWGNDTSDKSKEDVNSKIVIMLPDNGRGDN